MMALTLFLVNPIMKVLRYPLTMKEQYQLHYMCAFSMDIVFLMLFLRLQERIKTALVSYTEIEVQTIDVVVQRHYF